MKFFGRSSRAREDGSACSFTIEFDSFKHSGLVHEEKEVPIRVDWTRTAGSKRGSSQQVVLKHGVARWSDDKVVVACTMFQGMKVFYDSYLLVLDNTVGYRPKIIELAVKQYSVSSGEFSSWLVTKLDLSPHTKSAMVPVTVLFPGDSSACLRINITGSLASSLYASHLAYNISNNSPLPQKAMRPFPSTSISVTANHEGGSSETLSDVTSRSETSTPAHTRLPYYEDIATPISMNTPSMRDTPSSLGVPRSLDRARREGVVSLSLPFPIITTATIPMRRMQFMSSDSGSEHVDPPSTFPSVPSVLSFSSASSTSSHHHRRRSSSLLLASPADMHRHDSGGSSGSQPGNSSAESHALFYPNLFTSASSTLSLGGAPSHNASGTAAARCSSNSLGLGTTIDTVEVPSRDVSPLISAISVTSSSPTIPHTVLDSVSPLAAPVSASESVVTKDSDVLMSPPPLDEHSDLKQQLTEARLWISLQKKELESAKTALKERDIDDVHRFLLGIVFTQERQFSGGVPMPASILFRCMQAWDVFNPKSDHAMFIPRITASVIDAIQTRKFDNESLCYWQSVQFTMISLLQQHFSVQYSTMSTRPSMDYSPSFFPTPSQMPHYTPSHTPFQTPLHTPLHTNLTGLPPITPARTSLRDALAISLSNLSEESDLVSFSLHVELNGHVSVGLTPKLPTMGRPFTPVSTPGRMSVDSTAKRRSENSSSRNAGPLDTTLSRVEKTIHFFKDMLLYIHAITLSNILKELEPLLALVPVPVDNDAIAMSTISPILQVLSYALQQLHENFATLHTRTLFLSHLLQLVDIHLLNSILQRGVCCSVRAGEQMKLFLSQMENWLHVHDLPTRILQSMPRLAQTSKVILGNRQGLQELTNRRATCPSLSVTQLEKILSYDTTDKSVSIICSLLRAQMDPTEPLLATATYVFKNFTLDSDRHCTEHLMETWSRATVPAPLRSIPALAFLL